MVAMMAIAMVGCPQGGDNSTDNGGGDSVSASGSNSYATGVNSVAGCYGWYYEKLSAAAKVFYLSENQPQQRDTPLGNTTIDESFDSGLAVGDVISFVNFSKYDNGSTIVKVQGNMISVDALPSGGGSSYTLKETTPNHDDWSFFCPEKPLAGRIWFGDSAYVEGENNKAINAYSHAEGKNNTAYGQYAHAEGRNNTVGYASHAEGLETTASGYYGAHTEGRSTRSIGDSSHAEGLNSTAYGKQSHSEGESTTAIGQNSHAEGIGKKDAITPKLTCDAGIKKYQIDSSNNITVGTYVYYNGTIGKVTNVAAVDETHVEITTNVSINPKNALANESIYKVSTGVFGNYGHSEGQYTIASGVSSHAEGNGTTASGESSHSEGTESIASGSHSHAEGSQAKATGEAAHAEGRNASAFGQYSHAEGNSTNAIGKTSHAEGQGNKETLTPTITSAAGSKTYTINSSHGIQKNMYLWYNKIYAKVTNVVNIDGDTSKVNVTVDNSLNPNENLNGATFYKVLYYASGDYSHTEGYWTKATGTASHAEGSTTSATSAYSHAEGELTTASGSHSHAEGLRTTASSYRAHAEGADTIASEEDSHAEGNGTTAAGKKSHAEGNGTKARNINAHAEGLTTYADGEQSHAEGEGARPGSSFTFSGEANSTTYTTNKAHELTVDGIVNYGSVFAKITAIPTTTSFTVNVTLSKDDAISGKQLTLVSGSAFGTASHTEGYKNNAIGAYSHAEGNLTKACGAESHSEGWQTNSYGTTSHSEGYNTVAGNSARLTPDSNETAGNYTHAEGNGTLAKGNSSHAEGAGSQAVGLRSHAEGSYTITSNKAEHAEGQCNKSNKASDTFGNAGNTLHSVGIGSSSSDANRANAFEIMQNGDIYVLHIGGYNGKNAGATGIKSLQKVLQELGASYT